MKKGNSFGFNTKLHYTILTLMVIVFIGIGVFAYGGSTPATVGHSGGELDLSDGVNGNAVFNGNVSVAEDFVVAGDIDASGSVKIGVSSATCGSSLAGAIKYDSQNKVLQYCNGTSWAEIGTGSSSSGYTGNLVNGVHTGTDCANAGGNAYPTNSSTYVCRFTDSACPSGWTKYNSWSTTLAHHCTYLCDYNGYLSNAVDVGCTPGQHTTFANTPTESCHFDCGGNGGDCSATITSIGCY